MKYMMKCSPLLALVLFLLTNCTNDPASPGTQNPDISNDGIWKVSYYFDKDKDETSDFAGYTFMFKDNNLLEAVHGGSTETGSWGTTTDDGSQRLVINIGTAKPLSDLNDDWILVESNDQFISLKDDNPDHVEELHFERIQ